jgi:hypothetical protein
LGSDLGYGAEFCRLGYFNIRRLGTRLIIGSTHLLIIEEEELKEKQALPLAILTYFPKGTYTLGTRLLILQVIS